MKSLLAWILVYSGSLSVLRSIRIHLFHRKSAIVLCYHRISSTQFPFSPQCISPNDFEKHCVTIKKKYQVVDEREFLRQTIAKTSKFPRDLVLFTFDDGYIDNFHEALPILNRQQIPASFFVPTISTFQGKLLWYDEMSFTIEGLYIYNIELKAEILPSELEQQYHSLLKRKVSETNIKNVLGIYLKQVFIYLKKLPSQKRQSILNQLKEILIANQPHFEWPNNIYLTPEHLHLMKKQGHYIGGHTVSHPMLSILSKEEIESEISNSTKSFLESGIYPQSFAYPFGTTEDFHDQAKEVVKNSSYTCAFSTEEKAVPKDVDIFAIPRKVISPQKMPQILLKIEMLLWKSRV